MLSTVLSTVALAMAVLALYFAVCARLESARTARSRSPRSLSTRLDELEVAIDAHAGWWKKLNANVASLRASGSKRTPEPEADDATSMRPGETPEAWKKRMRLQMQNGGLKHA